MGSERERALIADVIRQRHGAVPSAATVTGEFPGNASEEASDDRAR